MTGTWHPLAWIPDRPPTRIEVVLALITTVWLPSLVLVAESISLPAVAVGVSATVVLGGPVASSAFGRQIGDWFRSVRVAWRALSIAVVAALLFVWGGYGVSEPVGTGVVLGSISVLLAMQWVQLLRYRTVSSS